MLFLITISSISLVSSALHDPHRYRKCSGCVFNGPGFYALEKKHSRTAANWQTSDVRGININVVSLSFMCAEINHLLPQMSANLRVNLIYT